MSTLPVPHKRPPTPGDILVGEFLEPLRITQRAFAEAIGITPAYLNDIVRGKRGITITTANRLAQALGTDAETWLNLQQLVDRWDWAHSDEAKAIKKIKRVKPAA